ncbi:hypothetical protein AGMMS49579_21030 [Spirochaetia bacterium]|nr:hypothetical protein AGMMS49579_21030 [Spirochaetia bacterium]
MFVILLLLVSTILYSQNREGISFFVRPVSGGTAKEHEFFHNNFEMEIRGARYKVVDTEDEADFAFSLVCKKGIPANKIRNTLEMTIIDLRDGHEIVTYGQGYNDITEMYDWILFMIYQGMANLPIVEKNDRGLVEIRREIYVIDNSEGLLNSEELLAQQAWEDQRWRNKWIYLTGYGSTGFDYGFSKTHNDKDLANTWYIPNVFGAGITGEFQFLNWMSVEVGAEIKISKVDYDPYFVIDFPLTLKFPLKPAHHFMISPYLGAQYNMIFDEKFKMIEKNDYIAPINFLVGAQFAVKAWSRGGFFLDIRYNMSFLNEIEPINEVEVFNKPMPYYYKNSIEIGFGYKFGWRDRTRSPQNTTGTPSQKK